MKIVGKEKFDKQIAALPVLIRAEIFKSLEKSAVIVTDKMRRIVPDDPKTTGNDLKSSIGYRFGSGGRASEKSTMANARYAKLDAGLAVTMFAGNQSTLVEGAGGKMYQNARLQEFGTQDTPAQPFFYPSYRLERKNAKQRLAAAITRGAKKAFAK